MFILVFLLLPLITSANITIVVKVKSNKSDIVIKYSGNDNKVLTNKELTLFNVTIDKLKKGTRVELGKEPDEIFLQDPTDYGNLFKNYKWQPVKRSVRVHKAKIVEIISEDIILKTHEYVNNSSLEIKSKRNISEIVESSAQSLWLEVGLPDDEIYYNIDFDFDYGHFKYKNKWQDDEIHRSKVFIEVRERGITFINPSETVVTNLLATKMILTIELEYKAELIGLIVAKYAHLYGKYHFWAPTVHNIMKVAGMRNEIISRERIEVTCFINPRLKVYDKLTGEIIEPSKKRYQRPMIRIFRKENTTRVLYTRLKKHKKEKYKP